MSDSDSPVKTSYTIPCSSDFRDTVLDLAKARGVNVGDLARSVLLVVPADTIAEAQDPGDPPAEDRETVVLRSGPSAGRPWRRKPRLQVRMAPGYEVPFIRRALGLALSLWRGERGIRVTQPGGEAERGEAPAPGAETAPAPTPEARPPAPQDGASESHALARLAEADEARAHAERQVSDLREELTQLRTIISILAFDPLPNGVRTRREALHVLGFPPDAEPDYRTIRAKYRMLAAIHHPDGHHGNHDRMSQLNAAMELLRR